MKFISEKCSWIEWIIFVTRFGNQTKEKVDYKEKIKELFFSGKIDAESLIISNSRHKQELFRTLENTENALNRVRMNEY